jgi:hypothetical protein
MIDILKISIIGFIISALIQEQRTILSWYGNLISELPWYLFRPLGGCYKCFVGQLCLWYFLIRKPFDIIELLFFVSAGIFCSMIYNKIYCFLKN